MSQREINKAVAEHRNEIRGTGFARKSKRETQRQDLDEPQVQHEIMHPEPIQVQIGGEPWDLYPLSARRRMAFIGLVHGVLTSSFQDDVRVGNAYSLSARMSAMVAERYLDRLAPFIAAATAEPGELDQREIDKLAADLVGDGGIQYAEISRVLDAMTAQNNVWEEIGKKVAPKA